MVSSGGHGSKNWVRDLHPRASGQVRKDNQSCNQERRSHCGTAHPHPTIAFMIGGFLPVAAEEPALSHPKPGSNYGAERYPF
jgi:hypothetical protein